MGGVTVSDNNVSTVTIDRIVDAAAQADIGVEADSTGRVAQGLHEDLQIMIVLLDSVFIARADSATDTPADTPEATLYLAANEVNSTLVGARAIVGNRSENLIVRTESEVHCAAGMNDPQLRATVTDAVDKVVSAHNAMVVLSEQIEAAQAEVEQAETERSSGDSELEQ